MPPIHPIATHEYPTPARRPANSVLDCGHIARELGIQPVPWSRGLDEVLTTLKTPA
jgi:dTDP-4-dehydrorhamnose reductase